MFLVLSASLCAFHPLQRLRQIASRKKEPSVHEKAQGSLLDGLLQILQYV